MVNDKTIACANGLQNTTCVLDVRLDLCAALLHVAIKLTDLLCQLLGFQLICQGAGDASCDVVPLIRLTCHEPAYALAISISLHLLASVCTVSQDGRADNCLAL